MRCPPIPLEAGASIHRRASWPKNRRGRVAAAITTAAMPEHSDAEYFDDRAGTVTMPTAGNNSQSAANRAATSGERRVIAPSKNAVPTNVGLKNRLRPRHYRRRPFSRHRIID